MSDKVRSKMQLIGTFKIMKTTIDIWMDGEGTIILGGIAWVEYYKYMEMKLEEEKRKEK